MHRIGERNAHNVYVLCSTRVSVCVCVCDGCVCVCLCCSSDCSKRHEVGCVPECTTLEKFEFFAFTDDRQKPEQFYYSRNRNCSYWKFYRTWALLHAKATQKRCIFHWIIGISKPLSEHRTNTNQWCHLWTIRLQSRSMHSWSKNITNTTFRCVEIGGVRRGIKVTHVYVYSENSNRDVMEDSVILARTYGHLRCRELVGKFISYIYLR